MTLFSNHAFVAKLVTAASTAMLMMTSAQARETQEIGKLTANFGGETITQPTVVAKDKKSTFNTAFLFVQEVGFSALSLAGHTGGGQRLGIEADFHALQPGPKTPPINLTISYIPPRSKAYWTSDEAPKPAKIAFTTLEIKGDEGRAVGMYQAVLCHAASIGAEPDTKNCRPIEGTFDTKFFVEKPKPRRK